LDVVRRILARAGAHLQPEGILIVEVGNSRSALERAFPGVPFVWLAASGGDESVFLLAARTLTAHAATLAR
jgi:ribosomal protein L3 glutamine methyltransferase